MEQDNRTEFNIELLQRKINVIEDETVRAVLFDILHMKVERLGNINAGTHYDYISIVNELGLRYKKRLEKLNVEKDGTGQ
jgi:hypothetical protein